MRRRFHLFVIPAAIAAIAASNWLSIIGSLAIAVLTGPVVLAMTVMAWRESMYRLGFSRPYLTVPLKLVSGAIAFVTLYLVSGVFQGIIQYAVLAVLSPETDPAGLEFAIATTRYAWLNVISFSLSAMLLWGLSLLIGRGAAARPMIATWVGEGLVVTSLLAFCLLALVPFVDGTFGEMPLIFIIDRLFSSNLPQLLILHGYFTSTPARSVSHLADRFD